jgi:hypothetical protein
MTTSRSLLGTIDEKRLSLGATRWFIAPYDTYVDEQARFDTVFPPSPFLDLGSSRPEINPNFTRELFKFINGVPKVLKDQKVIAIDGGVSITLDEFNGANLSRALLNTLYAFKNYESTPAVVQATGQPVGNVINLTSSTNFAEGDLIGLGSPQAALTQTISEYRIVEISGNDLILNRDVTETFGAAPYVGVISSWKVPIGSGIQNRCAILGVYEDLDGRQFLFAMPRAVIEGNFSYGISSSENAKITINVNPESWLDIDKAENIICSFLKVN